MVYYDIPISAKAERHPAEAIVPCSRQHTRNHRSRLYAQTHNPPKLRRFLVERVDGRRSRTEPGKDSRLRNRILPQRL